MTRYLFTIGVGVTDRPQRWLGICPIYGGLARALVQMGHSVHFLVNPEALDATALDGLSYQTGGHDALHSLMSTEAFDFGFIWGGRIAPDLVTREILEAQAIKTVFSELGWFPQKGTVYFDRNGTNSRITPEHPAKLGVLASWRFARMRRRFALAQYGRPPLRSRPALAASPLRVFVPLQDETDTNITEDSPFRTMNELIGFLARTYPDDHFTVRPHPRAEMPLIEEYRNVDLQDNSVNPVETLSGFDMVLGINSTLLSEAAFLGHRVAFCGNGLARIYGLAAPFDPAHPPARLQDIPDPGPRPEAFHHLLTVKQLSQSRLSSPDYLKSTYLRDMLALDQPQQGGGR